MKEIRPDHSLILYSLTKEYDKKMGIAFVGMFIFGGWIGVSFANNLHWSRPVIGIVLIGLSFSIYYFLDFKDKYNRTRAELEAILNKSN